MIETIVGMDDTTRAIIEGIMVRYDRPTVIRGGHKCRVFYDVARLSPNDLARLAAQAVGHLPEGTFDAALGIAYAGIFFAAAIAGGRQVAILQADGQIFGPPLGGQKVLLVDDVVYSGRQMLQAHALAEKAGARVVGYACIVDRSEAKGPPLEKPVWSAFRTAME